MSEAPVTRTKWTLLLAASVAGIAIPASPPAEAV